MPNYHERVKMQDAAEATGNGTAMNVSGLGTVAAQVSGTFVGTVTFEGTTDGSNWVSVQMTNIATGAIATTATAAGLFVGAVAGLVQFRARVSARSSGSITVVGLSMAGEPGATNVNVNAGSALIGKVSIDQVTANANEVVVKSITAGETHVGEVGGNIALVTGTVTLPAGTPSYSIGDLVANSAVAGSVVPIALNLGRLASGSGATGMLRRLRLRKTGTSITNASFRLHFYRHCTITCANGDDGAFSTDQAANYVGKVDVTMDQAFTDGASGNGVPAVGNEINFAQQAYDVLIEARAAYTRAAGEVFSIEVEVHRN